MVLKSLSKALLLSASLIAINGNAQLSTNPDKFLGNITTNGQVNGAGVEFASLWNQITPENETKWSSVQGGSQDSWTWGGADNCSNYAKNHHFPFKFHCLLWGAQYPGWIDKLNDYDRFIAVCDWMDAAKKRYPTVEMIDVVNEAVQGHQPNTPTWYGPLGGQGETGFDWIVKAFDMAYERFPETILIYNDFNTFQWNTQQFIDLVTKLRDAGAPIDAYGCQSHDLGGCSATTLKNSMNNIQNALKMPMYITEYDIGTTSDANQLRDYKAQIPLLWEADYCAGVTLWGFNYGSTWTNDGKDANGNPINPGHSGIIKNGVDRPAMTWLREYMASDKAKNAKSPFPGMKKPISFYIRPHFYKAPVNEPNEITITARMHNGAKVEKVELYADSKLVATVTEPTDATKGTYTCYVTPTSVTAKVNLKAIAYTNDGETYERLGGFYGNQWPRKPYGGEALELPGILEAENFNMGGKNISYYTSSTTKSTTVYRDDQENVKIIATADEGNFLNANSQGDWFDYTLQVNKTGKVNYRAVVGSMEEGAVITLYLFKDGYMQRQVDIEVPKTGRKEFTTLSGSFTRFTSTGEYKLRIQFSKKTAFVDKILLGSTTELEALGIEDINCQEEGTSYTVYSPSGIQVGQIEAAGNADAIRKIRNLTNTAGIYIIRDNASGKSKTVAVK